MPYVAYTEEELIELCDNALINRLGDLQKQMQPVIEKAHRLQYQISLLKSELGIKLQELSQEQTVDKIVLERYYSVFRAIQLQTDSLNKELKQFKALKHEPLLAGET